MINRGVSRASRLFFAGVLFFAWTAGSLVAAETEAAGGPPWELGDELDEVGNDYAFEDGFINLRLEGNTWRAYFIDEEREIVEPEPLRLLVQWERQHDRTDRGVTELRRSGGNPWLGNPRVMRPPHIFRVTMAMMEADSDEIVHEFPFRMFRQIPVED